MQKLLIGTGHFLFRIACVLIFLCNMFVLCLYGYLRSTGEFSIQLPPWQRIVLSLSLFVLFLIGLMVYWPKKEKLQATPSKRPLYRRGFTIVSIGFFLFLVIDTGPPKKMFTREYITSDSLAIKGSTPLLKKLFYGKEEAIPNLQHLKRKGKYEDIEAHTAEIEGAWHYIVSQRTAVERLSGYEKVLHEMEEDYLQAFYYSCRLVGSIYQSYVLLRARQADLQSAVEELALFHEVTRKGLEGSVNLIQKMIWIAVATDNLRTALQLVSEYPMSIDLRKTLTQAFAPITIEEASFFKPWVGEYLLLLEHLDYSFWDSVDAKIYFPEYEEHPGWYQLADRLPEPLVEFLYQLTFQKNRTAQHLYAYWTPIVHTAMEQGFGTQVDGSVESESSMPLRNIGGWCLHGPPQFLAYEKRMIRLQRQSELLAALLSIKGTPSLNADNGLRDAGEDGKLHTKDDVVLELYYLVQKTAHHVSSQE